MDELLQEMAEIDAVAAIRRDYQKTLALLRALKAGTIGVDDITMLPDGWRLVERPPPAAEPKTEKPESETRE
jgi:hypothetical protein